MDRITILGVRGSVPVSGADYARYGGATTSVLVQLDGEAIVLDAGTGLLRLPPDVLERSTLTLVLSHAHLDHLCGLSMCPYVMRQGKTLELYAAPAEGMPIADVLNKLYAPPVWPVPPERFGAAIRCHDLPGSFSVGSVRVESMDGVHPGGVKLLRLRAGGRSVVFATDFTLTDALRPAAADFARGCDVLLCDGQYSEAEWPARAAFGHNTWAAAAAFGADCGAGRTCIVHHDPTHTDAVLDGAMAEVRKINPNCEIAREGEVIAL